MERPAKPQAQFLELFEGGHAVSQTRCDPQEHLPARPPDVGDLRLETLTVNRPLIIQTKVSQNDGGTPNHPKSDCFGVETPWFWGSTMLRDTQKIPET